MVRWSRRRCSVLAALVAAACSSGSEAPRVTDIAVTPGAVSLASIGATQQMTATVHDENGNVMTGQTVTWSSTNAASATIGSATGLVTAVANGTTSVSAAIGTVVSGGVTVSVAQVAASLTKQGGDGQSGTTSTALGTPITVRVADAGNVAIAGAIVTFTPAAGSGSVSQSADTTGATGLAQVTWTLGASGGAQSVTASVPPGGASLTAVFGATASAPGTPTSITALTVTAQTALVGYATNSRPAVVVRDAANAVVAGAIVTFAVTAGGGSPTKPIDTTDANGVAQVGAWTVGAAPGANTMTASVGALTPATFNATGQAAAYAITLNYQTAIPSAGAQASFDTAVAAWQSVIFGDLLDFNASLTINPGQCGIPATGSSVNVTTVDDLMILVRFDSIDGPSVVLGSAGPCFIRTTGPGNRLTIVGQMRFDTADVATFVNSNRFTGVVLHEMGHVLGFGTLWTQAQFNCLQNPSIVDSVGNVTQVNDAYFNCAGGRAAFDSIGGTAYTGGNKVPVENAGGGSTVNGHWREAVFDEELMTGFAEVAGVANPLSLLTVRSFEDLGYTVNYAAQQAYSQTFSAPPGLRAHTADGGIQLLTDIDRGPIWLVDRAGRIVGVVHPR